MYFVVTSEESTGFKYCDVFKEKPVEDSITIRKVISKILSVEEVDEHKQAIRLMLSTRISCARHNMSLGNYTTRTSRK